ncbi:MAG: dihydrofolate reductase family protein [Candidatus Aenigmarchaeota archaeon]|nr:dihydrofolate reductase family protein [Candidatus Aenigmarchaeota archaeon]
MKVIMFMAMTTNGMIARENDAEDFLSDENWYEFCRMAKKSGCFVIGRRTYDVVRKLYEKYNFDDVEARPIVVSRKNPKLPKEYIVAVSPRNAIKMASRIGFKSMILTGGSNLNSSFMKLKLVDEIIVNVEPAVLGKGIHIFSEENFYSRLQLLDVRKFKNGIVQLHYKVINHAKKTR